MNSIKKSTIYDVALKAGVSSATVSRVLNNPATVAAEKRQRVLSAIKELDFVPNADAVANARKQYHKIGVIAPFFTQPSFMQRLRGVSSVLTGQHYELVVYAIDAIDDLDSYIEMLVTGDRVDGLIVLCLHLDPRSVDLLRNARFPVCFVEEEIEGFDDVIVRNLQGGQKAAEYLYGKGCRNPGFLGEQSTLSYAVPATEERFTGFQFYFANQGITISPEHIWVGEFTEQKLDEGIKHFLDQKDRPDGVFCSSDLIAARFMHLAAERGIMIPRDMLVLGFDDIDISGYIGLSSVCQGLDESGRLAAELVLGHITEPEREIRKVLVPLKIIERETTGRK